MTRALRVALPWLALTGPLAACSWFEASSPACVSPDGGMPCTEPYCKLVREACAKRARLCTPDDSKPASGECDLQVCAEVVQPGLRSHSNPAEAARDLFECVAHTRDCMTIGSCFETAKGRTRCEDTERARHTDTRPLLPTHVRESEGVGLAGVVVLPGDDLGCLQCALQPTGCAHDFPDCFSASPASASATDTCLDYRTCLRSCEQTRGDDALRYAQCVSAACDGPPEHPEHPLGKASFAGYRRCMFERCSACFQ